ncbi:CCA tRNA nucleotidyltransferase [Cohnella herbarum]|uniref:CCA tRNA nucleotidyltransferase n=1 Tax=Cohnella herbarum TaxID=2728023 RepID=A0A7Z2VG68_9BACL|nr:CCA tRNA nucleotidyltransferase [Cohnella herbarum]QJD82452.1 CCA tRNA nucleotidyltransferase [Cohnella herbarum]
MELTNTQDESLWMEGLDIVRKLEASGHRAYLVGGCVRDRLLGRALHDIDIATSATPDEVIALYARTLPTGLKHGTVTVMEGGRSYEVTTFRQEFGFTDSRRPDQVAFVQDVREDLARRDFTFNAMAFGSAGEIVDPFGGQDALRAGVVDCVGEASERFGEDALRMLRAIRFASELDFMILPEVWQGIIEHRPKLSLVAMERVSAEWDKMIAGSGPEQACHYLFKSGLLVHVKDTLPETFRQAAERYRFNGMPAEWDKWGMDFTDDGSMGNLMQLPSISDPDLRWAALLSGMGVNEEDSSDLCRALRFSARRVARISGLVGMNEQLKLNEEDELWESWVLTVLARGRSLAEDWLAMSEALETEFWTEAKQWLEEMPVVAISDLKVRGNELSAYLGKAPGPWITEVLKDLLEWVAFGEVPNEKQALLKAAENACDEAGGTDE